MFSLPPQKLVSKSPLRTQSFTPKTIFVSPTMDELKHLREKCAYYEDKLNKQEHKRTEELLINENEELRQFIVSIQEQMKQLRKEKETQDKNYLELVDLKRELNEKNKRLEDFKRLEQLYESVKMENDTLLRMIEQKDKDSMQQQLEEEIEQIHLKYQNEIDKLNKILEEKDSVTNVLGNHIKEIDQANEQLTCLYQEQRNYQETIKELKNGMESKNNQIDEMVLKYGEQDEEIKQLKIDLSEREAFIQQLLKELESSHQRDVEFQQNVNTYIDQYKNQQYETEMKQLMDERNQYKKLAEQQYNECQMLRNQLVDTQEQIQKIKYER